MRAQNSSNLSCANLAKARCWGCQGVALRKHPQGISPSLRTYCWNASVWKSLHARYISCAVHETVLFIMTRAEILSFIDYSLICIYLTMSGYQDSQTRKCLHSIQLSYKCSCQSLARLSSVMLVFVICQKKRKKRVRVRGYVCIHISAAFWCHCCQVSNLIKNTCRHDLIVTLGHDD